MMHTDERYRGRVSRVYGGPIGKIPTIFYDVVSVDSGCKALFTHVVPTWRVTKDPEIEIEALAVGTPCEIVVVVGEPAMFDMPIESIVWAVCTPGGG